MFIGFLGFRNWVCEILFCFSCYFVEEGWIGVILSYVHFFCWIWTFELLYRMVVFRGGKSRTGDGFRGFGGDVFVDLKIVYCGRLPILDSVDEVRAIEKYRSHGIIFGYSSRTG